MEFTEVGARTRHIRMLYIAWKAYVRSWERRLAMWLIEQSNSSN